MATSKQKDIVISLENVWKIYKLGQVELAALKGVSLDVERRSFISLMGPSGSGKSTLLHILGGLDTPTKGTVLLDGHNVNKLSENSLAQVRGRIIGFVFQQFNLLPNLTATENVMLPMAFQGATPAQRRARARELLTMIGLSDRLDHRPNELSGGERQRVAIARALANDPDIIVADEPTGNLDTATGEKIMEIFEKLHKEEQKTIIIVTHDAEIAEYGEHTIHMRDGEIQKKTKTTS